MNALTLDLDRPADVNAGQRNWLATALDTAALRAAMTEQLRGEDLRLQALTLERYFPSAKGPQVVVYEATLSQDGAHSVCRLFGVEAGGEAPARLECALESLSKKRRRQLGHHERPPLFMALPDFNLVLRPEGYDEKIDALALLRSPGLMGEEWNTAGLLAHRLHRRAVIRLQSQGGGRAQIVKLFRNHSDQPDRLARITRFLRTSAFAPSSSLQVPEIFENLGGDWPAIGFEAVPGEELGSLSGSKLVHGMHLAGEAAARLHGVPLRLLEEHGVEQESALLMNWVQHLAAAFPEYAVTANAVLTDVLGRLGAANDYEPHVIHRDLHERQLLCGDGRAWLIDFDTFAMGDPAQDVGNFIAHLRWSALCDGRETRELEESFRAGYERRAPLPCPRRTEAHLRATLLRLACIHAFGHRGRRVARKFFEECSP